MPVRVIVLDATACVSTTPVNVAVVPDAHTPLCGSVAIHVPCTDAYDTRVTMPAGKVTVMDAFPPSNQTRAPMLGVPLTGVNVPNTAPASVTDPLGVPAPSLCTRFETLWISVGFHPARENYPKS